MSTKELKLSIAQIVEQINDVTVLEAYYEILKNLLKVQRSQLIGYDEDGNPITGEKLESKILDVKNRIDSGQSMSDKELREDFKNW